MVKDERASSMNRQILLVADDNEDNRLVFATILRHNEYDVIEAVDGATAIEAAIGHRPDLILLDLRMPGLTGWETIEKLKSHPITTRIPVIAVSAERPDSEALKAAGFCAFIPKPILPHDLAEAVATCLDGLQKGEVWQDLKIATSS